MVRVSCHRPGRRFTRVILRNGVGVNRIEFQLPIRRPNADWKQRCIPKFRRKSTSRPHKHGSVRPVATWPRTFRPQRYRGAAGRRHLQPAGRPDLRAIRTQLRNAKVTARVAVLKASGVTDHFPQGLPTTILTTTVMTVACRLMSATGPHAFSTPCLLLLPRPGGVGSGVRVPLLHFVSAFRSTFLKRCTG